MICKTSCHLYAEHFEAAGRDAHYQVVLGYLSRTITLVEQHRVNRDISYQLDI